MNYENYYEDMKELIQSTPVQSMHNFRQHGAISCLNHCLLVSYMSYIIAHKLGLDYKSTGRGALVHDLFLYNSKADKSKAISHLFSHSKTALENAKSNFVLNEKEENIIESHMWPLGIVLPNTKESIIVNLMDKVCAIVECFGLYKLVSKRLDVEFVEEYKPQYVRIS